MVFRGFLPEVPSFGAQVARNLGQGFSKGLEAADKLRVKRRKALRGERSKISPRAITSLFPDFKNEMSGDDILKLMNQANELVESGYDANTALALTKKGVEENQFAEEGEGAIDPIVQERQKRYEEIRDSRAPNKRKYYREDGSNAERIQKAMHAGRWDPETGADPIKHPGSFFTGVGTSPYLTSFTDRLPELGGKFGTDKLSPSYDYESETPIQKKTRELGQDVTDNIILFALGEGAITAMKPVWPLVSKPLKKAFSRLTSRSNLGAKEAGSLFRDALQRKNVDLGEVAAGNPSAVKEFVKAGKELEKDVNQVVKSLEGRVSKEFPEQPAKRAEKVREKRPLFRKEAEIKGRKAEVKAAEKLEPEVRRAEQKKAAEKAAVERERPTTTARKEAVSQQAHEELPALRKKYQAKNQRIIQIENQLAKVKGQKRNQLEALLKYEERELGKLENDLLNKHAQARSGQKATTFESQQQAAHNKIQDLKDKIKAGEKIKFQKWDYNPDRIKKAKEIRKLQKKEKLPSRLKNKDSLYRAHENYADVYRQELNRIGSEIEQLKKTRPPFSKGKISELEELQQNIKKLLEHAEADVTIHGHNLNLRQYGKTARSQARTKAAKPVGESKVSKESVQKVQRATEDLVKKPTTENAKKAFEAEAEASKGKKDGFYEKTEGEGAKGKKESKKDFYEDTKKQGEEFKKERAEAEEKAKKTAEATEDLNKKSEDFWDGTLGERLKYAGEDFKNFWKAFKKSPLSSLVSTKVGINILVNSLFEGYEKVTGEKVAGYIKRFSYPFGLSRRGLSGVAVRGVFDAVHFLEKKHYHEKYKEAIRKKDYKAIKKYKEKLSPKRQKEARLQMRP